MFKPIILTKENDKTGALDKVEILKKSIESDSDFLAKENVTALYWWLGFWEKQCDKNLNE